MLKIDFVNLFYAKQLSDAVKTKKMYTVGIISDQVQNNHAAWVVGGKGFKNYAEAVAYAAELDPGPGESIYFQEDEDEE